MAAAVWLKNAELNVFSAAIEAVEKPQFLHCANIIFMRTNEDPVLLPVTTGPPYAGPTLKKESEILKKLALA
jgi:hypothetical protein